MLTCVHTLKLFDNVNSSKYVYCFCLLLMFKKYIIFDQETKCDLKVTENVTDLLIVYF